MNDLVRMAVAMVVWASGATLGTAASSLGTNEPNAPGVVRLYTTGPAYFEQLFTAIVSGEGTNAMLSFNGRDGRTRFARLGETLGSYTLAAFDPTTQRVFRASVNSWFESRGGRVRLDGPGVSVTLDLGVRLAIGGFAALLAETGSGCTWAVQSGETADLPDGNARVEAVTTDAVMLTTLDGPRRVVRATDAERAQVEAAWTRLLQAAQIQADAATRAQADDLATERERNAWRQAVTPALTPAPQSSASSADFPAMLVGGDYPVPIEWTLIPGVIRPGRRSGRVIVLPTKFARYPVGIGFSSKRVSIHTP